MQIDEYSKLQLISLEECGLLKCHVSDPIYKFCLLNNVCNLGDFIKIYQEKRSEMDKRHNFNYFDGIVDLIMIFYSNGETSNVKILMKEFEIIKRDFSFNFARVKGDYFDRFLRRLGLTHNETKAFLDYVAKYGQEMLVITAIKSYLHDDLGVKIHNREEQTIFLRKFNIFNNYFESKKEYFEGVHGYSLDKAEKMLLTLFDLYKKKEILEKEISRVNFDFIREMEDYPTEAEDVKSLLRRYNEINCKID